DQHVQGRAGVSAARRSVGALPHRPARLVEHGQGQAHHLSRHAISHRRLEQFMKQGVPRWLTTDDAIVAGYIELVDKVCPCVVLVHSQSGAFGFKVAEARPDKVRALVAVEPTLGGDRNKVALLKNTPVLIIYGDNAKEHPRWSKIRQGGVDYAGVLKGAG